MRECKNEKGTEIVKVRLSNNCLSLLLSALQRLLRRYFSIFVKGEQKVFAVRSVFH